MKTVELQLAHPESYYEREAYNALRTNFLFCGANIKTVVFTSCLPNEGKTTVAMELAKNLAEAGKKVLFLDADMRKSVALSRYTNQPGLSGLSQVLSGQVTPADAILQTQFPGLHVLFSGPFPPNPTELLGGETFHELLKSLAPDYDHILIDSSPLGLVVDSAVIAGRCDGAVLVINRGKTRIRTAKKVTEQIRRSGCRLLGVVFNHPTRSRVKSGSYGAYGKYGKYAGNK